MRVNSGCSWSHFWIALNAEKTLLYPSKNQLSETVIFQIQFHAVALDFLLSVKTPKEFPFFCPREKN